MSPLLALAAKLEALAGWLDDAKAAGNPPKYLVAQAVNAVREIAATARADAKAGDFPARPEGDSEGGKRWLP